MCSQWCAAVGCNNSGTKLSKFRQELCDRDGLTRQFCMCTPEPFYLIPFPLKYKHPDIYQSWLKNINRRDIRNKSKIWLPTKDSVLCSKHFESGSKVQTLFMDYEQQHKKPRKPPLFRTMIAKPESKKKSKCVKRREEKDSIEAPLLQTTTDKPESSKKSKRGKPPEDEDSIEYVLENVLENKQCSKCRDKIAALEKKFQHEKQRLLKPKFGYESLKTDKMVKRFTGIPTKKAFDTLYEKLKSKLPYQRLWLGNKSPTKRRQYKVTPEKIGRERKLCGKDQMLLALMKLRLGLITIDLAQRFEISESSCSRTWFTWIRFLSDEWKCLIFNPTKEVARENLPKAFKNKIYCNVRHIIDCTEIFIETPKNLLLQAQTWSNYKHHQTVKCLVSITPTGHFNFISDCWGGRVSDKVLTQESGFLDLLEPGDVVMADRGFPIADDVAKYRASLYIPPGRRGNEQFTKTNIKQNREVANLRIYVEQAIRRLKTFHILKNEVPLTLLPAIDDIVTVCAALCNLLPPVAK